MEGTTIEVGSADGNLLDAVRHLLGGDFVGQASRLLGEPEGNVRSATGALVPALLATIANKGATPDGARRLLDGIASLPSDVGVPGNLSRLLGGSGTAARDLMSTGSGLVQSLLGSDASSLASTIGSMSGLRLSSVTNLLALVASLIGGMLKRFTAEQGLDARGLTTVLSRQRGALEGAVDGRLANVLHLGTPGTMLGTAARAVETPPSDLRRLVPWLLGLAALVLLIPLLRPLFRGAEEKARTAAEATGDAARTAAQATADAARNAGDAMKRAVRSISLPDGIKIEAPTGGFIDSLVASLSSTAPLGTGVAFDSVTFTTASATLDPISNQQIEQLAAVLKAYPSATVSVEGHTDNSGDAAANLKLSQDRAAAVKAAVVGYGIAPDRIATTGYGQERPIASNDTDAGRAQNRRVELVVTAR